MILRVFGDETYFDCIRCAVLYVTFHVIEFLFPIEYMTGQNVTGKLSVNMMSLYECITTCIRRMATMLLVLPPTRSPIIAASNCKSTRQANENAWTIFHNSAYRVEKFVDFLDTDWIPLRGYWVFRQSITCLVQRFWHSCTKAHASRYPSIQIL